jgi:DnaJ family protein C protein 8
MLLIRENGWTLDSPEIKTDDFQVMLREKTVKVLVDNEHRRRRQMKAQLQEEGREQRKADEEAEARRKKRKHEEDWEKTREQRIGSWRDFKDKKAGGEKKKKKKLKPIG